MADEEKFEAAVEPEVVQAPQQPAQRMFTEEQVRQIIAAQMWQNPKVMALAERALGLADTFVNGMVHEKKLLAWSKPIVLVLLLVAVIILKCYKVFDGDVAILIGTIAGYFFGHNKANE